MIVLPMVGLSSRFTRAGYPKPKFMLEAGGRTMFVHAINSFSVLFDVEPILIICRDDPDVVAFVKGQLAAMRPRPAQFQIVTLEAPTAGQAETVALGLRRANVDRQTPLTIFNIDTMREDYEFPEALRDTAIDGYIEVFRGEGEHWSFVRPELPHADAGRAMEVTEKVRISDLCSTGLYYFRTVGMFLDIYESTIGLDVSELQGGERYVAPLFNIAICRGFDIRYAVIPKNVVTFMGTPDEYEAFRGTFPD